MKKWVPIGTILSLCFSYLPMALTKPLHLSIFVPKDLQDNAFGSRFTTITEEQLKHQYISTFTDALQNVPGLNIGQSGSIGGLSSVWIRGAESNHFALFINDIEIPRFSGSPDLSKIPSNQIERIIITRGPQGDLSGAAAGAIHIYTYNKAFSTKDSVLTVRAGHTTSLSLHLENATDTTTVQSRLSYQQDQGWDASLDLNGQKDGARHFALSLNTTHALQSSLLVSANMLYANITSEFDNISPGCGSTACYVKEAPYTSNTQLGGFRVSGTYQQGNLVHTPNFSLFRETSTYKSTTTASSTDTVALAQYQVSYKEGTHQTIKATLAYKVETFANSYAGKTPKSRTQRSLILGYQGHITKTFRLRTSLRLEDNDRFQNATGWSIASSYDIIPSFLRLHGSIGQGQVPPTFFEQFGFIPGEFMGNSSLKPEKTLGGDTGLTLFLWGNATFIDLTIFKSVLTNEIKGYGQSVQNLTQKSLRTGLEMTFETTSSTLFSLRASYTYLKATDAHGKPETRRPTHTASVQLSLLLAKNFRISVNTTYSGRSLQQDFSASSAASASSASAAAPILITRPASIALSLQAGLSLSKQLELFSSFSAPTQHATPLGYAKRPFRILIGMQIKQ